VGGRGGAGHVQAHLGDDDRGGDRADAGDLIQPRHRRGKRGDHRLDLGVEFSDIGVEGVDTGEHLGQQERVVFGEVPGERLFQHADLAAQRGAGHLGQYLRVTLASGQRVQHVPA
jgi:hypothetical protein